MDIFRRIRDALGFGPKLRCKPGDLCRVVDHPDYGSLDRQCIGMIVRVTRLVPHSRTSEPCWEYEGPLVIVTDGVDRYTVKRFCDDCLRPIHNPGDEEQDEMIGIAGPAPAVVREPSREEA